MLADTRTKGKLTAQKTFYFSLIEANNEMKLELIIITAAVITFMSVGQGAKLAQRHVAT